MSTHDQEKSTAHQDAAGQKQECCSNMHEGKFVSVADHKLVMTNKEGKECSHTLASDARLTCDGAVCKAEDLKAGHKIRVTTKKDDRNVATGVECINKHAEFTKAST
jgi:hypothetical protein